jgi:DNA-binding response OmpR family regulator
MKLSINILIVEDDPLLGAAMMETLATHGHAASLASSYDEAFEILRTPNRIQVIVLDLQLGANRGETLIHALRAAGISVPPVVVLSAKPMPDVVSAAKDTRAEVFLQKPCSVARLIEAVTLAVA